MITIKDEFYDHEKAKRAHRTGGAEALLLWHLMKAYAAKRGNGFVPDEAIPDFPLVVRNVKKAMKCLVDCGELRSDGTRGPGLVDPAPHGWMLHDYDDHATSADELEERRQRDRERKQAQRDRSRLRLLLVESGMTLDRADREIHQLSRAEVTRRTAELSRDVPEESHADPDDDHGPVPGDTSDARAHTPMRTHARECGHPGAAQPSPAQPQQINTTTTTGNARASGVTDRAARFVVRLDEDGKPLPRRDELEERFGWSKWFPSQALIDWARKAGLSDQDFDNTLVEVRDKLSGLHDVEWWDVRVLRFLDVAIDRKLAPAPAPQRRGRDSGFDLHERARALREAENAGTTGEAST